MHDHNLTDYLVAGLGFAMVVLTSDKTLIFLSIVLVLVRIYATLKARKP